jgi:hypothetical protein
MIEPNPHQFKLFYGGRELRDAITHSYDIDEEEGDQNLTDMWKRKVAESKLPERSGGHGAGVYESLLNEGVRPDTKLHVNWSTPYPADPDIPGKAIYEGHHRVASAADIEETTGRAMWFNVANTDAGLQTRLQRGLLPLGMRPLPVGLPRLPPIGAQFGQPRPVGQPQAKPRGWGQGGPSTAPAESPKFKQLPNSEGIRNLMRALGIPSNRK